MAQITCGGSVSPGYEPVRERFERHFDDGIAQCAQVCIYVRGEKVVDLWGERREKPPQASPRAVAPESDAPVYGPGGLQNVFSSTKVLTSLVVAMLVDRGRLRYDQLVTDIWPEYGTHGKECTTIAQVMRHEASIPDLDQPLKAEDLTASRLKQGSVSDIIANQRPLERPGTVRRYHTITRGWIANEIVRRADEKGRTIGEFLREEVAEPLGVAEELVIGLPDEFHDRVTPLASSTQAWTLQQLLLPRSLGGGRLAGTTSKLARAGMTVAWFYFAFARLIGKQVYNAPVSVPAASEAEQTAISANMRRLFNHPAVRRCEVPSANGHASARAMAAVAAALAEGGTFPGGPTLLSPKGLAQAMGDPVTKSMFATVGEGFTFTNAGWCLWGAMRLGYVGWLGFGGSVLQWHPEAHIGFAYAMNLLEPAPWNARAFQLQSLALRCADAVSRRSRQPASVGGQIRDAPQADLPRSKL